MAEEFQESDVIFRQNVDTDDEGDSDYGFSGQLSSRAPRGQKKGRRKKQLGNSIPINIPAGHSWVQSCVDSDFFDEDGELVPPHLIVGRRMSDGKVAFSVSSGRGRTLKGRELSEARNKILRLTGFLET